MKGRRLLRFIILSFLILLVLSVIVTRRFTVIQPASAASKEAPSAVTKYKAEGSPKKEEAEGIYESLPEYAGEPGVSVNDGMPYFTEEEILTITEVVYSDLDELGRCGPAYGLIGPETVPNETRGPIGDVRPSGWHTVRYDDRIEDRYLYNRCHLIGYQLAGANAEPRNLITGTRYLNVEGMLPYENAVLGYINRTGNHVLYRVTPVFEDDNLVASGVLLEAYSAEDKGEGIRFCEYLFNVQPGVIIDYKTGDSREDSSYAAEENEPLIFVLPEQETDVTVPDRTIPDREEITYVLNTNTKRFHYPSCPSVEETKEKNRAYSTKTREELIEEGYTPCGRCRP